MNRYELAHHEVESILSDRLSAAIAQAGYMSLADAIVDRLVETGMIQSTTPGDLIPNGLQDGVHKAGPHGDVPGVNKAVCFHCGVPIGIVPGGSGPVWVHTTTGAVAGTGAPR